MTCPRSRGRSAVWPRPGAPPLRHGLLGEAAGCRMSVAMETLIIYHPDRHRQSYGSGPQGGPVLGDAGAGHSPRSPSSVCPTLLRAAGSRRPPKLQGHCPLHGHLAWLKSV